MKSSTVWGDHKTSRWEFQNRGKAQEAQAQTLADQILPAKDIKQPEEEVEQAATEEEVVEWDALKVKVDLEAKSSSEEALAVLKSAVLDFVEGDITLSDLKEVVETL